MSTYNCLIVDDEPMARQIIEGYCKNIKNLQVVANCENAFEASEALAKHKVDVLFLDINLPVISGLNFLKTLPHPPQVIITTAYKEFALDGFELGVCDYLLKPISIERFLKAVQKAMVILPPKEKETPTPSSQNSTESTHHELILKTETKTFKIPVAEIVFLEAKGNYTQIITDTEIHKIYAPLYKIEEELHPNYFLRIHRSYVVAVSKIRLANYHAVKLGQHELPVGRNFKDNIKKWMK